jgi:hypothetical protein
VEANKTKWREESQEAREALDSGAQSFGGSPDGTMFSAIPRLQLNLREFWRKHKQDFSDYWTRLPDAEKRGFLLASSPYMTEAYASAFRTTPSRTSESVGRNCIHAHICLG